MLNSGFRKLAAGVAMAVGLGIGSAQAAINADGADVAVDGMGTSSGELFFSILDGTNKKSLTLDLNVGVQAFLANPLAGVSVQSNALQAFIAGGDQAAMVWNVAGLNNDVDPLGFPGIFVVTTVDPDSTPAPFGGLASDGLTNGIANAGQFLSGVNGALIGDVAEVGDLSPAYFDNQAGNWSDNFGGPLPFDNAADFATGETAAMVIIGARADGLASELVPNAELAQGFWSLDGATGTVSFQPVPIPAAVWLFGSAILGLVGIRRRA